MHCYRVNPLRGAPPTARDLTCDGPSSCTCRCDDCHEQRMEDLRAAREALDRAHAISAKFGAALLKLLRSACPNAKDHPTMWRAWGDAAEALGYLRNEYRTPCADKDLVREIDGLQ